MENCIDTLLFGQVCDKCDGGAIFKVVSFFLKTVSAGVLVLAVIGIIICGVMLVTSRDNAGQVAKAKKRMIEIIIGIVVYALMFTVINFIIPGGVITSTLDSSTSSCPEVAELPDPDKGSGGDEGGGGSSGGQTEEGKYPFATVVGKPSEGFIKCPRNADYTYQGPSGQAMTPKDEMYQSVAHSCPFTKVEYTDNDQDELCAPGGTMHYVADRKWCIVNSKIDVFQYQKYMEDNHIIQDGWTCKTDGKCVRGDKNNIKGTWNMSDYGACNYFANTIAWNLNTGEVVSNDAYIAQVGYGWWDGYNRMTLYGNAKASWRGTYYVYDDGLTLGRKPEAGQTSEAFAGISNLDAILEQLRQGKAVSIATRSGNPGGGHYMTAVGYQAEQCAKKTKDGAYGKCYGWALIVLNTTGSIYNMGKIGYCLGYGGTPCK